MAMAVAYSLFLGVLAHESRSGTKSAFVSDTLGSIAAILDSSGASSYEAQFWPYGEERAESGSNTAPWAFVGSYGYFRDVTGISIYVRARYLAIVTAQWLTSDPRWPGEPAYTYSSREPVLISDPSGEKGPGGGLGTGTPRTCFGIPAPLPFKCFASNTNACRDRDACPGDHTDEIPSGSCCRDWKEYDVESGWITGCIDFDCIWECCKSLRRWARACKHTPYPGHEDGFKPGFSCDTLSGGCI